MNDADGSPGSEAVKFTIKIDLDKIKRWLKFGGGVLLFLALVVGARQAYRYRLHSVTQRYLTQGYPALAFEYIDSERSSLASSEGGCRALLGVYSALQKPDRLQWTTEACRYQKIEIIEIPLAQGQLAMMRGQEREALSIFERASTKFRKPEGYLAMLPALVRRKNEQELQRVVEVLRKNYADDVKALVGLVQLFRNLNQPADAKQAALRLNDVLQKRGIVDNSLSQLVDATILAADSSKMSGLKTGSPVKLESSAGVKTSLPVHEKPVVHEVLPLRRERGQGTGVMVVPPMQPSN